MTAWLVAAVGSALTYRRLSRITAEQYGRERQQAVTQKAARWHGPFDTGKATHNRRTRA